MIKLPVSIPFEIKKGTRIIANYTKKTGRYFTRLKTRNTNRTTSNKNVTEVYNLAMCDSPTNINTEAKKIAPSFAAFVYRLKLKNLLMQ